MKRSNLAKAIYDLGKLAFGGVALAQIAKDKLETKTFVAGIAATIAAFIAAWLIDKEDQ